MLELDTCYTLTKIPYLTYEALDDYAEAVVCDFSPECLGVPSIIDVESFIEYYLHLTVDFRRVCYNHSVLGMTAFNDGMVNVICEETGQPEEMFVNKGTVIIDTSLTSKRNEPRLRFTMTHEGAHWLIHRKAFRENNLFGPVGVYDNRYLAAKTGFVDYSRSQKERNDIELMERQADFLASAILMPRPPLRKAFRAFFDLNGEKPRRIIRGMSPIDDCLAMQLPGYIANIFNVSRRAAQIRLEKLTAIVNKGWPYCY